MPGSSPAGPSSSGPRSGRFILSFLLHVAVLPGCAGTLPGVPAPGPAEIPVLEANLRDRPGDADLSIRLGAAYLEAERPADARRLLERGLELRPGDPAARYLLGLAHEQEEAWGDALAQYASLLDAEDSTPLARRAQRRLDFVRRQALTAEIRASLDRESELATTDPSPGTVAVFPLQFGSGGEEYRPLGRAFAELLTSGLGRIDRVTVLERQRVQLLLDELALADDGFVDPATAARSGRLLGAGRVVQGRLDLSGQENLEVLAAVVRVGAGAPSASAPSSQGGTLRQFYEVQERVLLDLFAAMDIELTPVERDRVTQRPTESLEALLAFGRALEAEDQGDFSLALEAYQAAAALDGGFSEASQGASRTDGLSESSTTSPAGAAEGVEGLPGPARDAGADWGIDAAGGGISVDRSPVQDLLDTDRLGANTILNILLRIPGS